MLRMFTPKRGILPQLITEDSVEYSASDQEAIQFISTYIGFVNQYRYRDHLFLDKNYSQQQCQLDIEARERFVERFLDKKAIATLKENLTANLLKAGHKNMIDRHQTLNYLLDDFDKYKYFAHLTAIEVAVVSGCIEKLYAYVNYQIESIQNNDIKKQLSHLLRFMESLEVAMYEHMKKHLAILQQSEAEQPLGQYHGDILSQFYEAIRALFIGKTNFSKPEHLIVDDSLLIPIPVLPLDLGGEKIALTYFQRFVACYEEKIRSQQGVRGMLTTVTGFGYNAVAGTFSLGFKLVKLPFQVLGYGFDGLLHLFAEGPAKTNDEALSRDGDLEQDGSDSVLLKHQAERAKTVMQSLQQNKKEIEKIRAENEKKYLEGEKVRTSFADWKERIKEARQTLEQEIKDLSGGCFAFLFTAKVKVKQEKRDALQSLWLAKDCRTLLHTVNQHCQSKKSPIAFQGLFSRTEKLFNQIKTDLSTVLKQ